MRMRARARPTHLCLRGLPRMTMGNVPIVGPIMRIMGRDIAKGPSVPLSPQPARTAIRLRSLPWHWSRRLLEDQYSSIGANSEQRFFGTGRLLLVGSAPSGQSGLADLILVSFVSGTV